MSDAPQENAAAAERSGEAGIDRSSPVNAPPPAAVLHPVFRPTGERFAAHERPVVEVHDFANPLVLDELVLRSLKQRHEEFAAFLSARLSIFLRLDFTLKLQRVSALAYRRFTSTVGNPSHVVLFKLEALAGVGVVEINPRIGLSVVDRMLGGTGKIDGAVEGLTEIEMNLLDDVVHVLLEEWCRMWGGDRNLISTIIGRENGGRYLQTSASDTAMLVGVFEASLGECSAPVQIAMPFPSMEGNVRQMMALMPSLDGGKKEPRRSSWSNIYNAIPLPLSVEWDAREMAVRDVLALAPGSIIRLPREIISRTMVRLSGVAKFVGEIGREDDRLAVRIEDRISPEDV